jgi:hypothetical protein
MSINSKVKGKVGELEFAHFLTDHHLPAHRGQQFSGGSDSPDVVCKVLSDVHFEVKRREGGNPYPWVAQAIKDAPQAAVHVVAHRRNGKDWLAILPMEELLRLLILRDKVLP